MGENTNSDAGEDDAGAPVLGLEAAASERPARARKGKAKYFAVSAIDAGDKKWSAGAAYDGGDVESLLASGAIREE